MRHTYRKSDCIDYDIPYYKIKYTFQVLYFITNELQIHSFKITLTLI